VDVCAHGEYGELPFRCPGICTELPGMGQHRHRSAYDMPLPLPQKISVANYRSFAGLTSLDLKPLTLIYGWNNTGKSALLRTLPLIGDSVSSTATAPLELLGEAGRQSSFLDVKWKGPRDEQVGPYLLLRFDWADTAPLTHVEFGLDFSRERKRTLVKTLAAFKGEEQVLDATHVPEPDEQRATVLTYDVRVPGQAEQRIRMDFEGLVPKTHPMLPVLANIHQLLLGLRGQIQWLGALRHSPRRLNPDSGSAPQRLSSDGRESAQLLRMDADVLAEVSGFYAKSFDRVLTLPEVLPTSHFRMLLQPRTSPEIDVDLVDAGEGMMQLLPVLTAVAMARRYDRGGPAILAIEEPESHLHPNAQRELARHLCQIAASPSPPIIVLETHSFPLLLAIQVEIARGSLPRDRVVAYWVEQLREGRSMANRVTFDTKGRPEGSWPPNVFADQQMLARELVEAQRSAGTKSS
jgi:predicted ATPase